jgi:hypothetical protein
MAQGLLADGGLFMVMIPSLIARKAMGPKLVHSFFGIYLNTVLDRSPILEVSIFTATMKDC